MPEARAAPLHNPATRATRADSEALLEPNEPLIDASRGSIPLLQDLDASDSPESLDLPPRKKLKKDERNDTPLPSSTPQSPNETSSTAGDSSSSLESESDPDSDSSSSAPDSPISPSAPQPLRARIAAFLPQLSAANARLGDGDADVGKFELSARDADDDSGTEDEGDDAEEEGGRRPYIEMDLGLGVFEELKGGEALASGGEDEDGADIGLAKAEEASSGTKRKRDEQDILDRLLRKEPREATKVVIQEVEGD